MTLREQITEIGIRKINREFVKAAGFISTMNYLAQKAFIEQWPEGIDTDAIRTGHQVLLATSMVPDDYPAVTE